MQSVSLTLVEATAVLMFKFPDPYAPVWGNLGAGAAGQVTTGIGFGVLLMRLMGARQVTLFSWTAVHSLGFKGSEKRIDRYQCYKLVTSGKSK